VKSNLLLLTSHCTEQVSSSGNASDFMLAVWGLSRRPGIAYLDTSDSFPDGFQNILNSPILFTVRRAD